MGGGKGRAMQTWRQQVGGYRWLNGATRWWWQSRTGGREPRDWDEEICAAKVGREKRVEVRTWTATAGPTERKRDAASKRCLREREEGHWRKNEQGSVNGRKAAGANRGRSLAEEGACVRESL